MRGDWRNDLCFVHYSGNEKPRMSINKKQQAIKKAMIESLSATMGHVSEA